MEAVEAVKMVDVRSMSAETHKGSEDGDDDAKTEVGIETKDEENKDVDAAVGDEVVLSKTIIVCPMI